MPFTELVTPTLFAGALGVAAMSFWRRVALTRKPQVLALLGGALALLVLAFQKLVLPLGGLFSSVHLAPLAGAALLALSVVLAHRGSRLYTRLSLLRRAARRPFASLTGLRTDARRAGKLEGVFTGRLHSHRPVTSPGGVVCAFYRAELRTPAAAGERGRLLSREASRSESLCLASERGEVRLEASVSLSMAPMEARRCIVSAGAAATPTVLATGEGGFTLDAVSHERVGRLGQKCWVVGRYVQDAHGERLEGPDGGPVLLVMRGELRAAAARLRRQTWALMAGATAACAASAALLAL